MQVLDEAGLLDDCDLSGLYAMITGSDRHLEMDRTAKGTFLPIYDKPLSDKVRGIRFPTDVEAELAKMGDRSTQFIRDAVQEKLSRSFDRD